MSAGGERKLVIPASLAYGKKGVDGIPGGASLHFDVKLLSSKSASTKHQGSHLAHPLRATSQSNRCCGYNDALFILANSGIYPLKCRLREVLCRGDTKRENSCIAEPDKVEATDRFYNRPEDTSHQWPTLTLVAAQTSQQRRKR